MPTEGQITGFAFRMRRRTCPRENEAVDRWTRIDRRPLDTHCEIAEQMEMSFPK
jgi:hypothetical protein